MRMVPTLSRPLATCSLVALDLESQQMGVAVAGHWFSIGTLIPWAEAGVGAVATQAGIRVEYGIDGIHLMVTGKTAPQALELLLMRDPEAALRQVAMIDRQGNLAAHTGARCVAESGHHFGKNYVTLANMMSKPGIPQIMADAFENEKGDFADRMLGALQAAHDAGGHLRPPQSAAMLIVNRHSVDHVAQDVVADLRVEEHLDPLKELKRLALLHRAYKGASLGIQELMSGDVEATMKQYEEATRLCPHNHELRFWMAVALGNAGKWEQALPIFDAVLEAEPSWNLLIPRLIQVELLHDHPRFSNLTLA